MRQEGCKASCRWAMQCLQRQSKPAYVWAQLLSTAVHQMLLLSLLHGWGCWASETFIYCLRSHSKPEGHQGLISSLSTVLSSNRYGQVHRNCQVLNQSWISPCRSQCPAGLELPLSRGTWASFPCTHEHISFYGLLQALVWTGKSRHQSGRCQSKGHQDSQKQLHSGRSPVGKATLSPSLLSFLLSSLPLSFFLPPFLFLRK